MSFTTLLIAAVAVVAIAVVVLRDSADDPTPPVEPETATKPAAQPASQPSSRPSDQPESTRKMVALLEKTESGYIDRFHYANVERVAYLRRVDPGPDPKSQLQLQISLATESLLAGYADEAVQQFEALADLVKQGDPRIDASFANWVELNLAVAHLRKGEQDNCIARHTIDSCLFPITGKGVHVDQRGSRGAIAIYLARLQRDPADYMSMWLLNIAYQTVGEYPDRVPKKWLLPPSAFASGQAFPRYYDVAPELGVAAVGLAGGSNLEDFNRDGFLDIIAASDSVRGQVRFFVNNGDGTFSDRTEAAGLIGLTRGLTTYHADFDNDGYDDVLMLRGGWTGIDGQEDWPNSLLKNNGDGTFTDVTEQAGLLSFHPTQAAVFADFDNDGWLDLYIGNETGDDRGHVKPEHRNHPAELYRNNGDGTFTDIAKSAGVEAGGYIKGVNAGDFDNDGWMDLYVSRMGSPNTLFRNLGVSQGGLRFQDVTSKANVSEPLDSFPLWFWDIDNDGWLDLLVLAYRASVAEHAREALGLPFKGMRPKLYRNKRNGTFEDVTKAWGLETLMLAMGANFGDLDTDGYPDFYVGTGSPNFTSLVPNRMFRNDAGKRFVDVTVAGGFGHLQKGHGISFGDVDNDGDQDIYEVMGGAYAGDTFQNALYANPGHGHHWLKLHLRGTKANRSAIGARIHVRVRTPNGRRSIYWTVSTGGSFGANPLMAHVGLGDATGIETVHVRWPGTKDEVAIDGLEMDHRYELVQGGLPKVVAERSFQMPKPGSK